MNKESHPGSDGSSAALVVENATLTERIGELESQLMDLTLDYEGLLLDNQRLGSEQQRLVGQFERVERERAERTDGGAVPFPTRPDKPILPSRAIAFCRQHLPLVALPEAACCDIERLDRARPGPVWGTRLLDGFYAFEAYARRPASSKGGFIDWCKRSGDPHAWPATRKKVAMAEGQTVRTSGKIAETRKLPVDRKVKPSGQIEMVAHLKISEGGGDNIPRVYFHDDTRGASGKVHVGFVGPHRLMPNTRT